MKKSNFVLIFVCAVLILFGSQSASAQQFEDRTEKKALVKELRELLGMKGMSAETKLDSTNVGDTLLDLLEKDKELTGDQKKELKQAALAGKARLEKQLLDFTADKSVTDGMFEDVFFDLYDRNFTLGEIREIVVFYRTEAGQKAARFSWRMLNEFNKEFSDAYGVKVKEFIDKIIEAESERLRHLINEIKKRDKNKT